MRALVLSFSALLAASCSCGPPRAPSYRDPSAALAHPLGTNLDFVVDWSSAMPFVDLMKSSRAWSSGSIADFEGGPALDLDPHGWPRSLRPGQVVRTLMVWDLTTHPAGRYVVLWEGEGILEYFGGATDRRLASESAPHRDVIDLDPRRDGPGIGLAITATDPADPIRNVRVIVPGGSCARDEREYCDAARPCREGERCVPFEESDRERPFHPLFLRSLETYSAIRFMNWADANSTITPSFEQTWGDRTELGDARWAPRVPLEVMIDLANRLHAEPWITLPSRADDEYARRAGALFAERLDPTLRVWVEYSNEVWNTMFPQQQWAEQNGLALGLSSEPDEATLYYYARRTGELHRAFADGLGGFERMVRIYAGQAASPWRCTQILDFEAAATRADALAIAPYFGHTVTHHDREEWASLDPDAFFAREEASALDPVREMIEDSARLARDRNLSLVAYEGGQHYVGYEDAQDDPRIEALFAAANRDRRMERLYDRYLDLWRELGGGVLMHHVDVAAGGPHGYWGASEHLGQPLALAPKRRALMRFVERQRAR